MTLFTNDGSLSRRNFIKAAGVVGAGAGLASLFGPLNAHAAIPAVSSGASSQIFGDSNPFTYHCSHVHRLLGDELARTIANPEISPEKTALAIRTNRCPQCGTSLGASMPATPWAELGKSYS